MKQKIIRWINFNQHKDPEKYYREQLLLLSPFLVSEMLQKGQHKMWHDAYKDVKIFSSTIRNKFVCTLVATPK